jgi:hypothetical protein
MPFFDKQAFVQDYGRPGRRVRTGAGGGSALLASRA